MTTKPNGLRTPNCSGRIYFNYYAEYTTESSCTKFDYSVRPEQICDEYDPRSIK